MAVSNLLDGQLPHGYSQFVNFPDDSFQTSGDTNSLVSEASIQNGELEFHSTTFNDSSQQEIGEDYEQYENDGSQSSNGKGRRERHYKRRLSKVTYIQLAKYFDRSIKVVASIFKVSRSTFKRHCRTVGIEKWPFKKVCTVEAHINETALETTVLQTMINSRSDDIDSFLMQDSDQDTNALREHYPNRNIEVLVERAYEDLVESVGLPSIFNESTNYF